MSGRRVLVACVGLLLVASSASAQAITSYTLKISNVGAAVPVSSTPIPAASVVCNQAPLAVPAIVTNPTRVSFVDPGNPGKECVFVDNGSGPLLGLSFSSTPMQATMSATNSAGTSGDSAASNSFTRPGLPPPVLTGVKVGP